MPLPLDILFEDNHLLVVDKPALLPTMGVGEEEASLQKAGKEYLKAAYDKPGNAYLGITSRLDAPVTGVVVMAKTSKAAARLTEAFVKHDVRKVYLAAVWGDVEPAEGALQHYLRHDDRHRRVHVTHGGAEGARLAKLRYRSLAAQDSLTLLEVILETGRKHQIRVQLAKSGWPILGDRKYGSDQPFPSGIALHARSLHMEHPVRREPIEFIAPLPRAWRQRRDLATALSVAGIRD